MIKIILVYRKGSDAMPQDKSMPRAAFFFAFDFASREFVRARREEGTFEASPGLFGVCTLGHGALLPLSRSDSVPIQRNRMED